MGKIKSFQIKSLSKDLVNKYPNVFTINFNENKELLNKFSRVLINTRENKRERKRINIRNPTSGRFL